ncbi:MAG: hypothetical protein WKF40_00825 [Thermoleophilaceae bacterium]
MIEDDAGALGRPARGSALARTASWCGCPGCRTQIADAAASGRALDARAGRPRRPSGLSWVTRARRADARRVESLRRRSPRPRAWCSTRPQRGRGGAGRRGAPPIPARSR